MLDVFPIQILRQLLIWISVLVVGCHATFADEPHVVSLWTRPQGEDWPEFLGPARNGKSRERGIWTDWDRRKPRVVWQHEIGEGYAIGSVAAGRFIQADRSGGKIRIFCWNAETGQQLWQYDYPTTYRDYYGYDGGPRCSPLIDGDRVYVYGPDGRLICLGLADGQLRWECDTVKKFGVVQNFFGVGSTPAVYEDKLWVMVGGSPPEDRGLGNAIRVCGSSTSPSKPASIWQAPTGRPI